MPNIQIKNVPESVHRVWRHRAAEAGQSLQEYLLAKLTDEAALPTREEWLRRVDSRSGSSVPVEEIVQIIREDRESH